MRTFARSVLALTLVTFGMSGCGRDGDWSGPTPIPPGAGTLSGVLGPNELYPGGGTRFQAVAVLGTRHFDVTSQTAWSSSEPAILSVSADGGAVAQAAGTATISATYQHRTLTYLVVVMPAGTFRIWGVVLKKDVVSPTDGVAGTVVEVISGIGAGLKAVAVEDQWGEYPPFYALRGVAGPVTIVVSAAGYVTQTIELNVQQHTTLDLVMVPVAAP